MTTVDGRKVRIIDQGKLNKDSGPDFFNATIKLDGQTWSGDVEIHVKASDWYRHHHDTDSAYRSVILHVVEKDDATVTIPGGNQPIPQVRLICAHDFKDYFVYLTTHAIDSLPCAQQLATMEPLRVTDWITALAFERIIDKSTRIEHLLELTTGNWEETCYITLARALGTSTNSEPFQRLAQATPLRIVGKHSDNLTIIESLLLGQAGLLENDVPGNKYLASLRTEYAFLVNKFGLQRPHDLNWKTGRMRPANFPHRRIAWLARYLHGGFRLLSDLLNATTLDEARQVFRQKMEGYWTTHYNFNDTEGVSFTGISAATVDTLVINVAVPILYTYALHNLQGAEAQAMQERAIAWLEMMEPERNFITNMFTHAGLDCKNAFSTQAVIQLRRNYCEARKCIYCRFGHRLLSQRATV